MTVIIAAFAAGMFCGCLFMLIVEAVFCLVDRGVSLGRLSGKKGE